MVAMMIGVALMSHLVSSLTFCNNLCRHHRQPKAAHHYYTTQLQSSKVPIISTRSSSSGGSNSNIQNSKTRRRKHYYIVPCYNETTALLNDRTLFDDDDDDDDNNPTMKRYLETRASPFPTMPSPLFTNRAQAQFELLSNSLVHNTIIDDITTTSTSSNNNNNTITKNTIKPGTTKISSMALYLPKENSHTGQLEFVPAVTYPNPLSERVFIARDSSNSGIHQPPVIPSMAILGLPGFFQAKDLIPTYPFVSSSPLDDEDDDDGGTNSNNNDEKAQRREMMFTTASPDSKIGVSVVEEIPPSVGSVLSSSSSKTSSTNEDNNNTNVVPPLSVTLFSGLETLGVLMIWPNRGRDGSNNKSMMSQWKWSSNDKLQVSRAAKSLALALSMDKERVSTQISSEQFQVAMADSLHQVKSPLQALRTFGKLLQRQLAEENASATSSSSTAVGPTIRRQRQMVKLAENMAAQGERVVDLIQPMDTLVNGRSNYLLRGDVKQKVPTTTGVVLRSNFLLPNGSNYGDPASTTTTTTTTTTSAAAAADAAALESVQSSPVLGDFQMELAFPQDVLGSTVYASQMVSREKGINFDAVGFEPDAELPACLISSKQLQEAISNVLDNAIKYAPRRRKGPGRPRIPQVKVSIVANEPPLAAGCTIWVEDNGPGIPEAEIESVFERGYRSIEVRDEVEGSGLGLTVAKFWLNQMGGRIDVVEEGGPSKLQGTTVRVILFRDPET